jgi:hypothetical protein
MPSQREQLLAPMSLDALMDYMSNAEPGSRGAHCEALELS